MNRSVHAYDSEVSLTMRRYAIVLNNIGVSLLEKHCYCQAVDTLKDALAIVQSITHGIPVVVNNNNSTDVQQQQQQQYRIDATKMHNCAIMRVSNLEPSNKHANVVTKFESVYLSNSSQLVQKLAVDKTDLSLSREGHQATLIRIDGLLDANLNDTSVDVSRNGSTTTTITKSTVMDLESAIILHNIGIGTLCLSFADSTLYTNRMYQSAAIQALTSSVTLYIKTVQMIAIASKTKNRLAVVLLNSSSSSSSVCRLEILGGLTIVLNTLITSLQLLSSSSSSSSLLDDKAVYYQTILSDIQHRVTALIKAKERFGLLPPSASAA